MKCALIEFNHYHDETLPSLVLMLNRLGIEPDVYVPRRAARKNAFVFATSLKYRLLIIDGIGRIRGTPTRAAKYDLAVLSSIEPRDHLAADA